MTPVETGPFAGPDAGGLIYVVDVPRFRDANGDGTGDLRGVIDSLDYIRSLGTEWLWLLPVYQSPRRDNGYDVIDHRAIDESLGTVDDVRELIAGAHARGMRMILELVVQHTSDQHPWFQAARRDLDGPMAARYVWSREKPDDDGHRMFPGEETSPWQFDERANAYFHHTFYHFQPDLDSAHEGVIDDMGRAVRFLLDLGVDALRIDAATLLLDGTPGRPRPDHEAVFHALRGQDAPRAPWLIAEVDEDPAAAADFVSPQQYDAVFGFSNTNALWLSLARQDARPLAEMVRRTVGEIGADRVATFVRNVDELDLEQLTDAERDEVYAVFAPDPDMRIYGRGIRRGWPAMLGPDQFRMTLSLLFALPGAPVLFHGQELAAGDDLTLPGREAVRVPMPWERRPAQEGDADSPLELVRTLAQVRRQLAADDATVRAETDNPAVLVMESARGLVVHNLSATAAPAPSHGAPLLARGWSDGVLAPYGFGWFAAR